MIRRPLLFAAAGYSAAVFIVYNTNMKLAAVMAGLLLFYSFIIHKSDERLFQNASKIVCISFIAGAIAFAWSGAANDPLYKTAVEDPGAFTEATCVVKKVERAGSGDDMYLRIKASGVLINCSDMELDIAPGDEIRVSGTIDLPKARRNPGCFDYRLYLRSIGIRTVMSADSIVREDAGSGSILTRNYRRLERNLYRFRMSFIDKLSAQAGEETSAMMNGILFGDKGEIDDEVTDNFKKNGTMHILAVSGLHVGIIYAFLLRLWSLMGAMTGGLICRKKGVGFIIFISAFFLCYSIMAGFSPSVTRAVVMVMLHAAAQFTGRRYDLYSAAFAVYLGVLIKNPYMLFNTGFEMSFLAVLSLCMVIPYVNKLYQGILAASIAVQIGLGPFILYNFNYLSLVTVFVNVPVIALAGIIVPIGICQSVLLTVFGDSVSFVSHLLDLLCDMLSVLNEKAAVDGLTSFAVASPDKRLIFAYYLLVLFLASEEGRLRIIRAGKGFRKRHVIKVAAWVVACVFAFGIMTDDGFSKSSITFVDVGQGDCMCIRCGIKPLNRCNKAYLIDGGGNVNYNVGIKTLREYLLKNGMPHVDGAFVTHLHTDHYLGICQLAKAGMVDRLYVYDGNRLREDKICDETGLRPDAITYLCAGDQVRLDDDVMVQVLWPKKKTDSEYMRLIADEANENDSSLLFKVNYDGVSMMATGDMDENGEKGVIAAHPGDPTVLRSDILKVGHHGSKTSTSELFLNYVNPKVAVIQVGKNTYGHPTPEALERLKHAGAKVYRNDLMGAVGVEIDKGRIKDNISMCRVN